MKIAMVLHKEIILMRFYFVFVFLFTYLRCTCAERNDSNSSMKSIVVQEIMKKVSNITLNSLSKVPLEKKETLLNKIENKLRKSAKAMGPDANKYVKFIMEEFKKKPLVNEKKHEPEVIRKSVSLKTDEKVKDRSTMDYEKKQEIIKHIASKIQTLVQGYMKNAKTVEERQQIFEKIKKKIYDAANQKHTQLHDKHEELKAYSSLIAQGLEVSMRKMIPDDAVGRRTDPKVAVVTETASKEHKTKEIKKKKHGNDMEDFMKKQAAMVMNIQEIHKYKDLISQSLPDTSIGPDCDKVVEETCANIKSVSKMRCDEGKIIPIENLCNGVIDCMNQVDEVNCTAQAMEKVHKATTIMADVEASLNRKCFAKSLNNDVLASQNQIMRDVLETQMDFLKKNFKEPVTATKTSDQVRDEIYIKKIVKDVTMILSTLSYALDGALCAHRINPLLPDDASHFNDIDLSSDIDEFDNMPKSSTWSPKSCTCKGHFCKDITCATPCKRICWQRYSLSHFGCQAVGGGTSVSLNAICDGKLDCFDETDEESCATDATYSKFDALKTYKDLLSLLSTKTKSNDFVEVRNKFGAMHRLVQALQKQTMKTSNDNHYTIKTLRNECFDLLVSIYEDLLQKVGVQELDDRYTILLSINEKLVTALKLSLTGNEDGPKGCQCRGGLCALRRCDKKCIQACLAEPALTRYSCGTRNDTVSIESVCNGKKDCSNGEDEKDCSDEICRGLHLVKLRRNLQKVGAKHGGSIIGETINTWKSKVSDNLEKAGKTERPNHRIIVEMVGRMLQNLVMSFAAMEDYRKVKSDRALQEFIDISDIVKQTLKSCRH